MGLFHVARCGVDSLLKVMAIQIPAWQVLERIEPNVDQPSAVCENVSRGRRNRRAGVDNTSLGGGDTRQCADALR